MAVAPGVSVPPEEANSAMTGFCLFDSKEGTEMEEFKTPRPAVVQTFGRSSRWGSVGSSGQEAVSQFSDGFSAESLTNTWARTLPAPGSARAAPVTPRTWKERHQS